VVIADAKKSVALQSQRLMNLKVYANLSHADVFLGFML